MAIDLALKLIVRWDDPAMRSKFVFDGSRDEIDEYLQAVDEVQLAMSSDDQSEQKTVMRLAMTRLLNEFCNILKLSTESRQPPAYLTADAVSSMMDSSFLGTYQVYEDDDDDANSFTMSMQEINDLRGIVMRMNSAGHLVECVKAYITQRKSFVRSQFQKLDVPKMGRDHAQKVGDKAFGMMVSLWLKSFNLCFRYLFGYEKQLSWSIFRDFGNGTDGACFMETIKDSSTQLFNFAVVLGSVHSSFPSILQFYSIFYARLPEIKKLFHPKSSDEFFKSVGGREALAKVGDAVRGTLLEFENALFKHKSHIHPALQVHGMVHCVMNCMSTLAEHHETLTWLSLHKPPSTCKIDLSPDNTLSHHMTWILSCLVSNLEGNAKLHKDTSARSFFFMNNVDFVIENIRRLPAVKAMIGDVYMTEFVDKYNQAKAKYLSLVFDKLLHHLRLKEPNWCGICFSRVSRLELKLKSFNAELANVQRYLPRSVVTDTRLQEDLREAVITKLLPAYASFLERVDSLPVLQDVVKYSAKELETAIINLFMDDHIIPEG